MASLRPITSLGSMDFRPFERIEKGITILKFDGDPEAEDFGENMLIRHYSEQLRKMRSAFKIATERGNIEEAKRLEAEYDAFSKTEDGIRFERMEREMWDARAWEEALRCGVSARHERREIGTYEATTPGQKKAKDCVEAMVRNLKSSAMVMLYGPPGTGKTHLGVGSVFARIRMGASGMSLRNGKYGKCAIMATPMDISRRVRSTYDDEATETESKVIEDYASCGLLVVDEIGAGSGSDHEKQMLCDVLCKRYENKLPTLMISNLGVEDIKKALGDRVIDRMREDVGSAFIPMNWESYRSEQRKKEAAK